jgi:hypothetical protein
MYVDSRLQYMFETKIKQSFWERGDFPTVVQNGSQSVVLDNPWVNGTKAAPFDQRECLLSPFLPPRHKTDEMLARLLPDHERRGGRDERVVPRRAGEAVARRVGQCVFSFPSSAPSVAMLIAMRVCLAAPLDFLRAKNQWYNTWPQDEFHRAMVVCVSPFPSFFGEKS